MRVPKTAIYYARSEEAMINGSYYRRDSEKNGKLAWYMNGDYITEIEFLNIPAHLLKFTRAEAKQLIPRPCK